MKKLDNMCVAGKNKSQSFQIKDIITIFVTSTKNNKT